MQAKAMVTGAFAADALSLGPHWIYEPERIQKEFGRIEEITEPLADSVHTSKSKGDFTHYGDQMLALLRSVSRKKGFVLSDFEKLWRSLFEDKDIYVDKATKAALLNFEKGTGPDASGSVSQDLAGVSRIAPLVYFLKDDPDALIHAVSEQTRMTHNNMDVLACGEFLAKTALDILSGTSPVSAIEKGIENGYGNETISFLAEQGMKTKEQDTVSAIGNMGRHCEFGAAFPATIHLVARYEGDYQTAMTENVMAGGDSAARGMAAGLLLCAGQGMDAIPESWKKAMNRYDEIMNLL